MADAGAHFIFDGARPTGAFQSPASQPVPGRPREAYRLAVADAFTYVMGWVNRKLPNEERPELRPIMSLLCLVGDDPKITQIADDAARQLDKDAVRMSFANGTTIIMAHSEAPGENPVVPEQESSGEHPVGPVVTEEEPPIDHPVDHEDESPNEHPIIPEEAALWANGVSATPEGFIAEGKDTWEHHVSYETARRMLGNDNTKIWKASAEAGVAIHIKKLEGGKYSFTFTGTDARIDAAVSMIHHVGS
ncbi:hypothetical protein VPNG_07041 [Cytospora leucostoma]|uniref:Uncharacterized protein n=1 Tax=Cytospora leucostoma TaxID=1230097 RepID=A0A423WNP6_9PEZI|nr:hypothetical protein VPNG_07041 [Cytospora leucostoma]